MMANSPEREDGQKEGEVTKEGQKQEVHTSKGKTFDENKVKFEEGRKPIYQANEETVSAL